jgi:hypothetical protein
MSPEVRGGVFRCLSARSHRSYPRALFVVPKQRPDGRIPLLQEKYGARTYLWGDTLGCCSPPAALASHRHAPQPLAAVRCSSAVRPARSPRQMSAAFPFGDEDGTQRIARRWREARLPVQAKFRV